MTAYVLGQLEGIDREDWVKAAARADTKLVFLPSAAHLANRLSSSRDLTSALFVTEREELRRSVDLVRDDPNHFATPILSVADRPNVGDQRAAYAEGADDVVIAGDAGGVMRRLANIALHCAARRPEATMGLAIVISSDPGRRTRMGRPLRLAGFELAYGASLSEVEALLPDSDLTHFVVASADAAAELPAVDGGRRLVTSKGEVAVLAFDEPDQAAEFGSRVADATARLLFFADEQRTAAFQDRRSSRRKLWAELCAFREAGSLQPVFGVSHNVSREGIYVRTLDPPREGSRLWIEMQVPVLQAPVHLRAETMWRRLPGERKGILPPGFGLRIDPADCPRGDLETFLQGYELLGASAEC
ncbi:MAG: PilZ domain-containing protein [Myxococcales bacterium]|nr:PilZ domain-containing protein [Myxococcales bacterium]